MGDQKLKTRGFTLVELLVVIAILGILSVVAYAGIQRFQIRSLNEKVTSDLLAIENALNQYKKDNGQYPTVPEPLKVGLNKNVLCFDARLTYTHNCEEAAFVQTQVDEQLLTKRYLQDIPTDPRSGSRYLYGVTSDGQFFQLAGNQLTSDDTWQAEAIDNLDEGSTLPSLIRAFDGPDFVADGSSRLPYSPDATNVSGRLFGLMGAVTVDGKAASEGMVVQAGSTVKTEGAAKAVMYFSDGSVTYLDESTQLRLLPDSQVAQNDKAGIITKIRLKLFQGKIWNKVVRLAEKSEFNVETTTAIAGVRGTEFGMDASLNQAIIYSGQLVLRQKTEEEMKQSNLDGQFLVFSSLGDDFLPSQMTQTKEGQFFVQTIPAAQEAAQDAVPATPTQEMDLMENYYKENLGLSLIDLPYIQKAQSHPDGMYSLYVTFNGMDDVLKINGFEIYGQSQVLGVRLMKEGALEKPLLTIDNFTFDDQANAYKFDINYQKNETNPLYNKETGQMESILLRAYQEDVVKTYSQVSWPPIGLPPDPKEEFTHQFDNPQVYQELDVMEQGQQGTMKITKTPPALMDLDATPIELTSSAPCVWSVGPNNSGAFIGEYGNVDKVVYAPLDPKLTTAQKGENVAARFKANKEAVSIKCVDPNNNKNFEIVQFTVAYKPKSQSAEYTYGYLANNGLSWNEARALCQNSTEGGFNDWHLPNKATYEKLVQAKAIDAEKKNLCELNGEGKCQDLGQSSYLLFEEEQNLESAWIIQLNINNLLGFPKVQKFEGLVFRCVR